MERAIEAGYDLEAIAVQESMIVDRLESLSDDGVGVEVLTLWRLDRRTKGRISDDAWTSINEWRLERNDVLRQMVKYGPNFQLSWRERPALARATATSDVPVVRLCDTEVRRAKRSRAYTESSPTLAP